MADLERTGGERAVRLVVLLLAIAIGVGSFVIMFDGDGWNPTMRLLTLSVTVPLTFWAGSLGSDAFRKSHQWDRLGLKRFGTRVGVETPLPPIGGDMARPATPIVVAGNLRLWLIVGAASLAAIYVTYNWASAAYRAPLRDGSDTAILAPLLLGTLAYLVVRSIVGAIGVRRAVVMTNRDIRLGATLGFWPPVTLRREEVAGFALDSGLGLLTTDGRELSAAGLYFGNKEQLTTLVQAWGGDHVAEGEEADEEFKVEAPPGMSVSTSVVELAKRLHARRMLRYRIYLAVGTLALIVASGWYINQRLVNDRLLEHGVPVAAEVVRVSDYEYNAEMTVAYTVRGSKHEATINSGFFRTFNVKRGDKVAVLVNPDNPPQARTPSRRNINSLTWPAIFAAAVLALVGRSRVRQVRALEPVIERGQFSPVKINLDTTRFDRTLYATAEITADGESGTGRVSLGSSVGGRTLGKAEHDAWMAESGKGAVFIVESPPRLITTDSNMSVDWG